MAKEQRPVGYADLLSVVADLPVIVRETRRRKGLSVRAAATQAGVSYSTLNRVENGTDDPRLSSFVALIRWAAK